MTYLRNVITSAPSLHFDIEISPDPDDATHWIPLAMSIGGAYVGRTPLDKDELVSAALEGICEAVKKPVESNRKALVRDSVHNAISRAIQEAELVRTPRMEKWRKGIGPLAIEELTEDPITPPDTAWELLDDILALCSDRERAIVELRVQGHSDANIAEMIGLSRTTVFVIRKGIYERLGKTVRGNAA